MKKLFLLFVTVLFVFGCAAKFEDTFGLLHLSKDTHQSLSQIKFEELKIGDYKSFDIDNKSDVFTFQSGKSYLKAFALPETEGDYFINIRSHILTDTRKRSYFFLPYFITLDENFQIIRHEMPVLQRFTMTSLAKAFKQLDWMTKPTAGKVFESEVKIEKGSGEKYIIIFSHPDTFGQKYRYADTNYISFGLFVLAKGMKSVTVPAAPMGFINIDVLAEPRGHVVMIDRSNEEYALYMLVTEEKIEAVKKKIKNIDSTEFVKLDEFLKEPESFISPVEKATELVDFLMNRPLFAVGFDKGGNIIDVR